MIIQKKNFYFAAGTLMNILHKGYFRKQRNNTNNRVMSAYMTKKCEEEVTTARHQNHLFPLFWVKTSGWASTPEILSSNKGCVLPNGKGGLCLQLSGVKGYLNIVQTNKLCIIGQEWKLPKLKSLSLCCV